ncbi:uncharacterized protein LOC111042219 [Myzus persicae]|uniref:uncharacterized protein LOC111042219 n=1 Tax=Myzus persicae TaxID=13164 RepID=UPI000B939C5E|nr:uncharacterized protein LOC111042219 [Myzus persicae]
MSDDQLIAIPVNRPDDCYAGQPPKDDAAATTCPVRPPKDETEMSDVVSLPKEDDAASLAPVPNTDDDRPSPSKEDASPAPPPEEDASPASPPTDGIASPACLSPLPLDETVPSAPRVEPEFSKTNGLENADGVQVKHEIKHETTNLGLNQTTDLGLNLFFYDDDDEAIGFDRGLEPDHIIGAVQVNGKLMFLMAWKNAEIADLLEATVVYHRCPQIAIQFFEPLLRFVPNEQRN